MKKIMFFDIDGTLLEFGTHRIPTTTKTALQALRKNDILIGLATGRQDISYETLFAPDVLMDFVISSNGRMVRVGENVIHVETISTELIEKLISFDTKYDVSLLFESGTSLAVHQQINTMCCQYMAGIGLDTPPVSPTFYQEENITQAMIFCDEETEKLFVEAFPELLFIRHAGNGIDIVTKGPMKENGVALILDHYQLTKEDALAFGDGMNDISMFEYIDGVCMGESHPDLVKNAIEQIGRIEEDGLFKYLKEKKYI